MTGERPQLCASLSSSTENKSPTAQGHVIKTLGQQDNPNVERRQGASMDACFRVCHCLHQPWPLGSRCGVGSLLTVWKRHRGRVGNAAFFFLYCFTCSTKHPNTSDIFHFCRKKCHVKLFSVFWTKSLCPKVSWQKIKPVHK